MINFSCWLASSVSILKSHLWFLTWALVLVQCSPRVTLLREYKVISSDPASLRKMVYQEKSHYKIGLRVLSMYEIQSFIDQARKWEKYNRIPYLLYMKLYIQNKASTRQNIYLHINRNEVQAIVLKTETVSAQSSDKKSQDQYIPFDPHLQNTPRNSFKSLTSKEYKKRFWAKPYQSAKASFLMTQYSGLFSYRKGDVPARIKKQKKKTKNINEIMVRPGQSLTTLLILEKPSLYVREMRLSIPLQFVQSKKIFSRSKAKFQIGLGMRHRK